LNLAPKLADRSSLFILGIDLSMGKIVSANGRACEVLGADRDALVGRRVIDAIPQLDEAVFRAAVEQVRATGSARWEGSYVVRGATVPIEVDMCASQIDPDRACALLVVRDITSQQAAAIQHLRLLAALDQAGESIVVTALDGSIEYVNAAFERITGYTRAEVIGQNPRILRSGRQDSSFYAQMWATLARGEPWTASFVNRRKDGGLYHQHTTISSVKDRLGRIVNYVGVGRDIGREVVLEARLEQALRHTRTIIDASPVGIMTFRASGPAISANQAGAKLLGATIDQVVALNFRTIASWQASDMLQAAELALATGTEQRVEAKVTSTFGRQLWLHTRLVPFEFDGEAHLLCMFTDFSEHKALEAKFLQAQKLEVVGLLAGGIAHDFNNIIAAILLFGGFVLESLPADDARRADLMEVINAANRAASLTRQLLTFSRLRPSEKRPTDVNQNLSELAKLLACTVGDHIRLSVTPLARPAVVNIDPVQFDQVVLNLAVNARDAMPDGGALHIALAERAGGAAGLILLTVTDTGLGMDAATQARIFEPFFTTKEGGRSTGLGLATCVGIVGDADGNIRVTSAPGRGTTFTVEFPKCREAVRPAPAPALTSMGGRGEKILLVEDEPALRRATERVLEQAGYEVVVAADGDQAFRLIETLGAELDLVISDVSLPGRSGADVVGHARHHIHDVAVILTSGFVDQAAQARQPEGVPLLWKPVSPADLLDAVTTALGPRRASHRAEPTRSVGQSGVVLVLARDAAAGEPTRQILETAGYVAEVSSDPEAVKRALAQEPPPWAVVCGLGVDGAGGDLFEWVERTVPALVPRLVGLARDPLDPQTRALIAQKTFRVLPAPVDPRLLLETLARTRRTARITARRLPRTTEVGPSPALSSGGRDTRPPLARERVLLVEDDSIVARVLQRSLRTAGFEVVVAGALGGARTELGRGQFDVLVTDLGLPDGSGLELLGDLRTRALDLPVVVTTGAPTVETASEAVHGRVREYLRKPLSAPEFIRAVREAADEGRVTRLRAKLLANRAGSGDLLRDLPATERTFASALRKLRMVYQPIVRAGDGTIYGFEVLLRTDEPTLATAAQVLAAADVLGRVDDLGRAVRASVATTLLGHRERLESIFVNVHPLEFRADVLAEVTDPLAGLARRVVLEVTERASLEVGPGLDAALTALRELGYRIAIDDLGEGYAGLTSLIHVSPDFVKIDISLVQGVDRAPLKRDIIAALVDVARRAGITVIAEGVETRAERDVLVELGCDLLQGFLFARPGPPFPTVRSFVGLGATP
jgi:PAS domain S-box-containing protein